MPYRPRRERKRVKPVVAPADEQMPSIAKSKGGAGEARVEGKNARKHLGKRRRGSELGYSEAHKTTPPYGIEPRLLARGGANGDPDDEDNVGADWKAPDGEQAFGRTQREAPGRKRGGRLTAHERQSLPKSDFAAPGEGEGPKHAGSGSYPIPDAKHARLALSMVSKYGSPEKKKEVRAKVHSKYPGIG